MGKYDEVLADAKVILTEMGIHSFHAGSSDCHLKLRESMDALYKLIPVVESKNSAGFFRRVKDAMFDTPDDQLFAESIKDLVNHTAQLRICKDCKCSNCVLADQSCSCAGCLYGAYVVGCEGGKSIERRQVKNGTITKNGMPVLAMEHDRVSGKNTMTVRQPSGLEKKIADAF